MQGDHQSLVVKDPDPKWSDTRKSAYCFNDLWMKFVSKERRQRGRSAGTQLACWQLFYSTFLASSSLCPSAKLANP